MTAEDDVEELPSWVRPPPEGFVSEDLDRLPGLPNHSELIDGSLVFFAPQTAIHSLAVHLFWAGLHRWVPKGLQVSSRMTIILDEDQRPEPDAAVIRLAGEDDPDRTFYWGKDVVLAVEVVSRDTRSRDRKRKPLLYAEAGIPHFWRAETETGRLVVHVHELDPATGAYILTGVHQDRLKLTVPFDLDIDLTDLR
ncbi:Uma2 family endonuclease [Nonomuraea jabiensis]|uniref:Uma2 family endonuclease n=1 Tax=Nonomuraea jabiensis TaxID=882448 RepID=A0A7W9LHL0_9ACTN|nr:Uma2 family endonuclease [Nonomuraea jabiensis]MBB5784079.1 Uma2 family endonuclease [Nonomuraea jabiensis]